MTFTTTLKGGNSTSPCTRLFGQVGLTLARSKSFFASLHKASLYNTLRIFCPGRRRLLRRRRGHGKSNCAALCSACVFALTLLGALLTYVRNDPAATYPSTSIDIHKDMANEGSPLCVWSTLSECSAAIEIAEMIKYKHHASKKRMFNFTPSRSCGRIFPKNHFCSAGSLARACKRDRS